MPVSRQAGKGQGPGNHVASLPNEVLVAGAPALMTDLYELTMLQAYVLEDMLDVAVFDLFVRRLPFSRNYLVACGLADVLDYLEALHFSQDSLEYLESLQQFRPAFLDYLADFRFTGNVRAVREGTVVFPDEPILEVSAPLPEAQLIETYLLNQVHYQTLVASKAARVVCAAEGRAVVDFGLRRYHGIDAGLKAARAAYIAGVSATSNVMAGRRYGIPVTGTMAHSYVLAHNRDREAFRRFAEIYPDTVLLVDTFDTLAGVREVVDLARRLGPAFQVTAIRLDSGDLAALAKHARAMLDEAGLTRVGIFASGDLDEHRIAELGASGAPVDGFGVGTRMGVSADAPYLNCAYKLVSYAGEARMKLSTAKATLPCRKQVFRASDDGRALRDVIALQDEELTGRPLLEPVMATGKSLPGRPAGLPEMRAHCAQELASLPASLRGLRSPEAAFPVELSDKLRAARERLAGELGV